MAKILHKKRLIWALFILIALGIFFTYLVTSIRAGNGNLLMPLDDVYIHFQYAKQMATGHPYQYNNIDPATSGATSFLYPYILAVGYFIGFRGLWLGLWAMLIGTVALIAAMGAVYRLCKAFEVPQWLALLTTVFFALTGSIAWHFMSGMETGLMMALTLWTLLFVVEKHFRNFIVIATFLSLIRPEGGVLAILASGTMFLRLWRDFGALEKRRGKRLQLLLLAIPILAIGVQPFVNLLITGTTVATGNQAKSILATVPHDWGIIISHILNNFVRMWQEFITGYDGLEGRGWYLPLFTGLLGLLAIPILFFKKNYRLVGLMLLGWLLAMTAAISTLDTAFWHFKRYQMPVMALFFPLSGWAISSLINRVGEWRAMPQNTKYIIYAYQFVIVPIFVIALFFQFLHYHAVNVGYVYQQPYQMALWLRENTPEESIVAVHDVGLMRYMGERNTLDIVGLTTPGAAAYWRNGPGSVAEFLINNQPDYIANYGRGHGYGLAYLADTSLYENELAAFPIENWQRHLNVALAADYQGIYQPDWEKIVYGGFVSRIPVQDCWSTPYGLPDDALTFGIVQVANIDSESLFDYQWESNYVDNAFVTEARQFNHVLDAYRLINGEETFKLGFFYDESTAKVLVTYVHARYAGQIDIYVNDNLVDTQWIPSNAGNIAIISTMIKPQFLSNEMQIRIVPKIPDGYYMPLCHSFREFTEYGTFKSSYPFPDEWQQPESLASYQDGKFYLSSVNTFRDATNINNYVIELDWYSPGGKAQGDYRFFVHLYDDISQPPIAQWDGYFADMPVGNWLLGYLEDTINLNIENVSNGTYQLAIGFYNPQNLQDRLIPESDVYEVTPDGRLWVGEITIDND